MTPKLTRRQILAGISSVSLLPAACRSAPWMGEAAVNEVFAHGVASGDPDQHSVVLWSRVSAVAGPVKVNWTLARDQAFRDIVTAGTATTHADKDFTVKALATGLKPGETGYYRFELDGHLSAVGRTRTLPQGQVARLGIAVASCANYPLGYFHAYRAIAEDKAVDVVVHLGDYIYEYPADGWGRESGERLGRLHLPAGETITLSDYRIRHAQYKSDPDLQSMHAHHPVIMLWDDHETANNPWMRGADNHQPDEGDWFERRDASLQAWFEWLPVRDPAQGVRRQDYWRYYRWGDLASLVTLEMRHTGRDQKISLSDHYPQIRDASAMKRFKRDVLGDSSRHMLSGDMTRFLQHAADQIAAARPAWTLLASPVQMARVNWPPLVDPVFDDLAKTASGFLAEKLPAVIKQGQLDLPRSFDDWGGYPAARERLFRAWSDRGIENLLVLSGDTHGYWANYLSNDAGERVGVELGTAGISSPGDSTLFGPQAGPLIDQLRIEHNHDVVWCDSMQRGYLRVELTHEFAHADFIAAHNPEAAETILQTLKRFEVTPSQGHLQLKEIAPPRTAQTGRNPVRAQPPSRP